MSDIPPPNELYIELRDQLVDDDVDSIKAYLRNTGLPPRMLEMCKTFTDICYKLEEKGKIKPDEDDYTFLEKMFHFLKMMILKDRVIKFAAHCRQSRKLQGSSGGNTQSLGGAKSKGSSTQTLPQTKTRADTQKRKGSNTSHEDQPSAKRSNDLPTERTSGCSGSSVGNPQSPGGAKSKGSSTQTRSKTKRGDTQKRKGSKTSHGNQPGAKRSKSNDRPTEGSSGCSGNSGTGSNPQSSGGPHSISSSKQKGGITGIGNSPVFNAKHVVINQTFRTSDQAVKNEKGKDDGDADPQKQESSDSDD